MSQQKAKHVDSDSCGFSRRVRVYMVHMSRVVTDYMVRVFRVRIMDRVYKLRV